MKHWIICSMAALGLATSAAPAQDEPKAVRGAITAEYKDAEYEITDTREVNGVKVYDARITTDEGQGRASVTEYGDFLLSSSPRPAKSLPKEVTRLVSGLFESPATDYEASITHGYLVDTDIDGKKYQLGFDAAGRLRDIRSAREIEREDPSEMTEASGGDRDAVVRKFKEWDADAEVHKVYEFEGAQGFYVLDLTSGKGNRGQIVMSPWGAVYSKKINYKEEDLPKPVMQSVRRLFKSADIGDVYRIENRYYRLEQPVGDEMLTLKIRPTGEVAAIRSGRAADEDEEAITAGQREEKDRQRD